MAAARPTPDAPIRLRILRLVSCVLVACQSSSRVLRPARPGGVYRARHMFSLVMAGMAWAAEMSGLRKSREPAAPDRMRRHDQPSFLKVYRKHCPDLKIRVHRSDIILLNIWKHILADTGKAGLTSEVALRPELDGHAAEAAAKLEALREAMQEVDETNRHIPTTNCLCCWQAVRHAEAMRQVAVRHIGELDVLLLVAETQLKTEMQGSQLKRRP